MLTRCVLRRHLSTEMDRRAAAEAFAPTEASSTSSHVGDQFLSRLQTRAHCHSDVFRHVVHAETRQPQRESRGLCRCNRHAPTRFHGTDYGTDRDAVGLRGPRDPVQYSGLSSVDRRRFRGKGDDYRYGVSGNANERQYRFSAFNVEQGILVQPLVNLRIVVEVSQGDGTGRVVFCALRRIFASQVRVEPHAD